MPTLKERIAAFFAGQLPTRRITLYNERHTPHFIAQTLDVDRAHSIIEAAEDGDPRELFALYREIVLTDSHIQNEFGKRKLAVLGDPMSIQPVDKKNAADVEAAEAIKAMIAVCPTWLDGCIHLLDSSLWPVAVLEKVYQPASKPGLKYELMELVPVPDQLLEYTSGSLRIRTTDPNTGAIASGFMEPDPTRYIVHRGHLLTTPDNRGGPMRSMVMWWLLSTLDRDWWARFLDKYGSPFLVGKYDQSDDASRRVLENAFAWAVRIGGLVVSKQTEVEVKQATGSSSSDAYERFLTVAQREKSKLILGQTLSSDSQPLGIGGGASKTQEGVRQDIRQWDALRLGQCLQWQLFRQYLDANGFKGETPKAVWGGESKEETQQTGDLLSALHNAGLQVTDEGIELLSERVGLPLERVAAPASMPPQLPLSAFSSPMLARLEEANDSIARNGAAELSQAFRGSLAPVRRMILESSSADDLAKGILASYSDWPAGRVAALIEQALTAYSANAVAALPEA